MAIGHVDTGINGTLVGSDLGICFSHSRLASHLDGDWSDCRDTHADCGFRVGRTRLVLEIERCAITRENGGTMLRGIVPFLFVGYNFQEPVSRDVASDSNH